MHKSAYMNMREYTDKFKALSDKTRLRIIRLLIQARKELCVCEIMDSLHESHYNTSRHLKELKICGIVKERKAGRWVFYSLKEKTDDFQRQIIRAVENMPENVFEADCKRLNIRLSLRQKGECVVKLSSRT